MVNSRARVWLLAVAWISCVLVLVAADVRGIRKRDEPQYAGDVFTCGDGTQIPRAFVNDDFCDCKDGSDEPGTSACVNGQFFCKNKGFEGQFVPSSRVNDGICDCCDGSDEFASPGLCADTCAEQGKAAQKDTLDQIARIEEGARVRAEWVAEAARLRSEKEGKLAELKQVLEEVVAKFEEAKRLRDEEERKEREAREAKEAAEGKTAGSAAANDPPPTLSEVIPGLTDTDEPAASASASAGADAAADTAPKEGEAGSAFPYPAEYAYKAADGDSDSAQAEQQQAEQQQAEQDEGEGESEGAEEEAVEAQDEAPQDVSPLAQALEEQSKVAEEARRVYRDADDSKRDVEREIEKIEEWLKNDHGPNGEFATLEGSCFSYKQRQYTYEMCPYGEAKQKEGHSDTSLGRFSGFGAVGDNKYATMSFTRGTHCWNGPDRSLTVTLECGASNELLSVDEPSKCVYAMRMATPAACDAAQAQQLRAELAAKYGGEEQDEPAAPAPAGRGRDEL